MCIVAHLPLYSNCHHYVPHETGGLDTFILGILVGEEHEFWLDHGGGHWSPSLEIEKQDSWPGSRVMILIVPDLHLRQVSFGG
jgi:hypothetical protein